MNNIEQLLPFLKLYTENWGERTVILLVIVGVLYYIYNLIVKLLNVLVILLRGYPPEHTDIDGGGYETIKESTPPSTKLPYGISIKETEDQKDV